MVVGCTVVGCTAMGWVVDGWTVTVVVEVVGCTATGSTKMGDDAVVLVVLVVEVLVEEGGIVMKLTTSPEVAGANVPVVVEVEPALVVVVVVVEPVVVVPAMGWVDVGSMNMGVTVEVLVLVGWTGMGATVIG